MLVKSIVMSTAAAFLGPTIGVALFFLANSDRGGKATSPTVVTREGLGTELGEAEVIRNFAPQGAHLDLASILVTERRPQVAASGTVESAPWRTVVICAVGQPTKDGRCPAPETVPTPEVIADVAPSADVPTSPLPGRMSVGTH